MGKWFKSILGFVILAFLLWYLARHWEQLKSILHLSPTQLLAMYFLYGLTALIGARIVQCLINTLHTKTLFWDMFWLHNAALLLNYVPMKYGTIFRANYLKHHYGLAYAHFASFFLYLTFLMTATATAVGMVVLLTIYGLCEYEHKILSIVFFTTAIGSIILLLLPLPEPKGQGMFSTTFRNFLSGRHQIAKAKKTVFISVILLTLNFLFTAIRFWIIYHSIGEDIHPGGYFILGALGVVTLFVGLTPGSLGIREIVLGFGAVVLGIPLEIGILAAMIDRAVTTVYIFTVGGPCVLWLWRKSPDDFKKQVDNNFVSSSPVGKID